MTRTFHIISLPLGTKKGMEVAVPALTIISIDRDSLENALYACGASAEQSRAVNFRD